MSLKCIDLKFKELESFVRSELSVVSEKRIKNAGQRVAAFLEELVSYLTYPELQNTENIREKIPYIIGRLYLFSERNKIQLDDIYKPLIPKDSVYFAEKENIASYGQENIQYLRERLPKRGELIETKKACKMVDLSYPYFIVLIRKLNLEEDLGYKQRHGYVKFSKKAFGILKKAKRKSA
jgi:hypothetical protein